jgi:hypothetical protein
MIRSLRTSIVLAIVFLVSVVGSAQRTIPRHIFVNVVDKAGAPIPGLTAADFELTEGGTPRAVTRVAFNTPMRILLLSTVAGASPRNWSTSVRG